MVSVMGFLGSRVPWLLTLEKKVRGGRNQPAVGGVVWVNSNAAERHRPGWWLPKVGLSLGRGCDIGGGWIKGGKERRHRRAPAGVTMAQSRWGDRGHGGRTNTLAFVFCCQMSGLGMVGGRT
jgi:hypothetical protein